MVTTTRTNTGNGPLGGWLRSVSKRQLVNQVLVYILLLAVGFMLAIPFIWLISSSLKTETDAFAIPPSFIPNPVQWSNYVVGLTEFPFVRSTMNTMILVVWVMLGTVLSGSLVAYGFARVRFPGRTALFILVLSTMMIPSHVTLIPQYLLFRELEMAGFVQTAGRAEFLRGRSLLHIPVTTVLFDDSIGLRRRGAH